MSTRLDETTQAQLREQFILPFLTSWLKVWFFHGRKPWEIVDRARLPIWVALMGECKSQLNGQQIGMRDIERELCKMLCDPEVKASATDLEREGLTCSSPPELTGVWIPEISRRADLTLSPSMVEVANILTGVPVQYEMEVFEALCEFRQTLPLGEREAFLCQRLIDEVRRIGDAVHYVPTNLFDWRGRIYANTRGTAAATYGKDARCILRFAESMKVTRKDCRRMDSHGRIEHGLTRDLAQRAYADPVTFLKACHKAGKDGRMALSYAFGLREMETTGYTTCPVFLDAAASGVGFQKGMQRHTDTAQWVDVSRADHIHAWTKYAVDASANHSMSCVRNMLIHEQIRNQWAKPCGVAGIYSATKRGMTANVSNISFDHEAEGWDYGKKNTRTPKIPSSLMPHLATKRDQRAKSIEEAETEGRTPLLPWNKSDDMDEIEKVCQGFSTVLRTVTLKYLPELLTNLREYWQSEMDTNGSVQWDTSLGARVIMYPYRRNTRKPEKCYFTPEGADTGTSMPIFPVEKDHSGSGFLAQVTHTTDSCGLFGGVKWCADRGVPTLSVHDAMACHICNVDVMLEGYWQGWNEAVHTSLLSQFGIEKASRTWRGVPKGAQLLGGVDLCS